MAERLPDNYGVLVTRPRRQAAELATGIRARGGNPILFPCIEIQSRATDEIERDLASLPDPDITIFVSRNAVEFGIVYAGGELAAIGPATAAAIRDAGSAVSICPESGFDSEHLLREPAFSDVASKTVRIIRGNPGREKLATELRARGARVDYLSTYERQLPQYDDEALAVLSQEWAAGNINAVVVMSVQSLECLKLLLPPDCREALARTLLVTPAARVLKEALSQHPDCPAILAAGPGPDAIVDCLAHAAGTPPATPPSPGSK